MKKQKIIKKITFNLDKKVKDGFHSPQDYSPLNNKLLKWVEKKPMIDQHVAIQVNYKEPMKSYFNEKSTWSLAKGNVIEVCSQKLIIAEVSYTTDNTPIYMNRVYGGIWYAWLKYVPGWDYSWQLVHMSKKFLPDLERYYKEKNQTKYNNLVARTFAGEIY